MLLTDKEIERGLTQGTLNKDGSLSDGWHPQIKEYCNWSNKAQLKKVVEWLKENSFEGETYSVLEGTTIKVQESPYRIIEGSKWQTLLKAAE